MKLSRILAVKLADLGDVLLCMPALRALRRSYPDARIDALVTPHTAGLLRHFGLVDRLLLFPKHLFDSPRSLARPPAWVRLGALAGALRAGSYDAVALFHHLSTAYGVLKWQLLVAATGAPVVAGLTSTSGDRWITHAVPDHGFGHRHEVEYALAVASALGAQTDGCDLHIPPFPDEDSRAQALLGDLSRPYVVIHPGSGGYSRARRWDPGSFAAVADALFDATGARVVVVGTEQDDGDLVLGAMRAPALNLQGRTDLADLVAVLRRCRLFIGADSGVMHLAAATGAYVVALFGPSNHRAWRPWANDARVRIVRRDLPCSPCSYVGVRVGAREGCPQRRCMAEIRPDDVIEAALGLWTG